ncbi:MAG: hypothetical protein KKD39_06270 [Candidatus Altiarchaeota archaeon]|nr:hypothetical protein [Candidatus Altiarchaeota archaeon]
MVNCGRCGRPIYDNQPICSFCRKTISKEATKKTNRLNRQREEQIDMMTNMTSPGGEEEEDATSVWVEEDFEEASKKKKP